MLVVKNVSSRRPDRVLLLIGIFKVAKAAILLSLGFGLALAHRDVVPHLRDFGYAVGANPALIDGVISRIASIDRHRLAELGAGALIYGGLFAIEGVGLLLHRLWAQYATIAITTSFIPLEVYEMVEHRTIAKTIVIALNFTIVVYLLWKLRRDEHWPFAP